jgi:hypothetical protein
VTLNASLIVFFNELIRLHVRRHGKVTRSKLLMSTDRSCYKEYSNAQVEPDYSLFIDQGSNFE